MTKSTKSSKIKTASLSQLNPKCAGIDIGASEKILRANKPRDRQCYLKVGKYCSKMRHEQLNAEAHETLRRRENSKNKPVLLCVSVPQRLCV